MFALKMLTAKMLQENDSERSGRVRATGCSAGIEGPGDVERDGPQTAAFLVETHERGLACVVRSLAVA